MFESNSGTTRERRRFTPGRLVSRLHRAAARVGAVCIPLLIAGTIAAQQPGWIEGTVTTQGDSAIVGAIARVTGSRLGTFTDGQGRFRLGPLAPGHYTVEITALGFETARRDVEVGAGAGDDIAIALDAQPIELGGIRVSVIRPDMVPQSELSASQVREANPRDVGDLLRIQPGLAAVRRGPLGLDPVVRGLRETEVGVYLDGTRQFPAGPARMDSPLTHLDPSALQSVEVVKGPYALTWGAGNMSAIRVATPPVPPAAGGAFHGQILTGYDTNMKAAETAASVSGRQDRVSYWLHGAWRQGDDYTTGDDVLVPADYRSSEVRGSIGLNTGDRSTLALSGGYQDQGHIDYPGRLLNARFFHAGNVSLRWNRTSSGRWRNTEVLAYYNDVKHMMDNSEKPTAEPNPNRTPPFPLDVTVDAAASVAGGRLAATLVPATGWEVEFGGDVYSANRDAVRHVVRADTDTELFVDLMWPDATILDAGAFVRASRATDMLSVTGTLRTDYASASADTVSQFFRDNIGTDLDATEFNISGALTVGIHPDPHWSLSLGAGSVVRTADATERYSDRVPASKAQTSAEFVGNPELDPERSTQADLWIDAEYSRVRASLNAFVRRIDNYITLEPTTLPKRLPLSPPTVYRYINGDATFRGVDGSLAWSMTSALTTTITGSWLRGQDGTLDEPALGVTPVQGSLALRYDHARQGSYLEGMIRAAGDQDRVASQRGETPTAGYATADIQGGISIGRGLLLRAGVRNIADRAYVDHLNAKNPFTAARIGEPGRVFWTRLSLAF